MGQHFLKDKNILAKIAGAVEIEKGEVLIEIGPGHGELTEKLLEKNKEIEIVAIEKDRVLAAALGKDTGRRIKIIEGDALEILPELTEEIRKAGKNFCIVGNIPYYITGHLLRILGEGKLRPRQAVFLVQKEVAQRVCAKPPKMNILSASVGVWSQVEMLFSVGAGAFAPAPKVESAVLRIYSKKEGVTGNNLKRYYSFARVVFKHPRKTVLNNLKSGIESGVLSNVSDEKVKAFLAKAGVNSSDRPQNVSLEQLFELSTLFPQ